MEKKIAAKSCQNPPTIGVYFQKPKSDKVLKGATKYKVIKAPDFTKRLQSVPREFAVKVGFNKDIEEELTVRDSLLSNFTIDAAMEVIAHSYPHH